jgi:hypothetical protein
VGGKFKSEYDKENNIISGPLFLLRIFRIFHFYSAVGVTAGVNIFVLIYAISMASTMLENLNSKNLGMILKEIRDTKRNIILIIKSPDYQDFYFLKLATAFEFL